MQLAKSVCNIINIISMIITAIILKNIFALCCTRNLKDESSHGYLN